MKMIRLAILYHGENYRSLGSHGQQQTNQTLKSDLLFAISITPDTIILY